MNPDKLNVLSSGGIKDLNYNSKDHGECALLPQSKNNITKGQKKKKNLALIRSLFHLVMPRLIESYILNIYDPEVQ